VADNTDDQAEKGSRTTPPGTPGGAPSRRAVGLGRPRELAGARRKSLGRLVQGFDRLPQTWRYVVVAGAIALAALVPVMLPYLTADTPYWTNVLTKVGIATLLALGLNVVVGFAGLLDLGYVAFFAVGAYAFAVLTGAARFNVILSQHQLGVAHPPTWHMYFWLFFFAALVIALVAGVILGAPTLRLRGDYLAIVTLGFGEIVRITANNLGSFDNGALGINNIPHPEIHAGGFDYSFALNNDAYYWLLLGVIVIWVFLLRRINDSRVGRAWAAIREDEVAAASMGIPTVQMKLWAFAMGAAVASFGGVIYASQVAFISPDTFTLFNVDFGSVIILAMVVVGGMGGIAGPIIGAALIIFLPERFRFLGDARLLVFGAVLVLVMVVRPQGLLPSRRRAAELAGGEVREDSVFEAREHGA
jgi:branched-chain amino acid transport system permease protein